MGSKEFKQSLFFVFLLFFSSSFFISCQSLKAQKDLNLKSSSKHSIVVDKSYLEYQSNLAYLKAEMAFLEGQSEKALEYLKTAKLFSITDSFHLKERQADFLKEEGLLTEALYHYKELEKDDENKKRIQIKLMECYVLNKLYSMALEENKKLIEKDPKNFVFLFQKAILLISQKKWEESLKVFQNLLAYNPALDEKIQTLLFQSYVLTELNREKEVLKTWKNLFKLDLVDEATSMKLANFYKKIGKTNWAMAYLKKFQKERGVTPKVSLLLFELAFFSNKWKEAFYYTQQLEDLGVLTNQHRLYKVLYLKELKKYEDVIPYLEDLVATNPTHGQYRYMLAVIYRKTERWNKAIHAYQKIPFSSSYFLLSQLQLATLWQKQGQYKESLKLLKRLSFGEEMNPQAVFVYAESLWKIGNKKQAVSVLTLALKEDPHNLELLQLRASYFKELGFLESSLKDIHVKSSNVSFIN
ncbi:MAG: hypothetical protein GDA46_00935 [Bdellovibrionales bacterium]|nr:hypothetical protein [Bdellovibrionales bacterium]